MNKTLKVINLVIVCTFLFSGQLLAQYLTPDVFIKGNFVEIGINNVGAYGSGADAPTGYHPRAAYDLATSPDSYPSRLGFVADVGMDGWTVGTPNFMGDYFVPGSPQEGWDMMVGTSWNKAYTGFGGGSFSTGAGPLTLTGANTGYSVVGSEKRGVWQGTMDSVQIIQTTILDTTKLYFIVKVQLKNLSSTTKTDIYYERTVDPDNEVPLGGSFNTTNTVVFTPITDENKALVTAVGDSYPTYSLLGLGAVDCRAKAYIIDEGTLSPTYEIDDIYTDDDIYIKDKGDVYEGDVGIGLIFNIGDLAPGDSTKLAYAYILSAAHLDSAFATLAPTLNTTVGSFGDKDTFYACVGDSIDINIEGGENYIWDTWTPSIGLESTSGSSNTVEVQNDTITYQIIGHEEVCSDYDTITFTIIPYVVPDPGEDGSGSICSNADPINLFTLLEGTPAVGGVWTGPGVTPAGSFNPVGFSEGTYTFTYTTANGSCTDSSHVLLQVINDVILDFSYSVNRGCLEDTVIFTNLSDSIVNFRWNFGDGSPHDSTNFNTSHIYTTQGEYGVYLVAQNTRGCVDSILKLVNTEHPLNAGFTQSTDSICQHVNNTVTFTDTSIGNIGQWYWDFGDGNTSTLQNPNHTYTTSGLHTVMLVVTDDVPCSDTAFSTVYVDPTPYLDIEANRDSICKGELVELDVTYSPWITDMNWNFGDGSTYNGIDGHQSHSYTDIGEYYISVSASHPICPDLFVYDTIFVKPYPKLNLGGDTMLCLQGEPILLDASSMVGNPPNTYYYWSTGDTTSTLKIVSPGSYRVVANLDGCTTTDEIVVNKDCYIDIPNSFTPNGDGNNDYFFPRQLLSKGVVDFQMNIYNRWGQLLFETNNADGRGWDGKFNDADQPGGVYIYQISVRYKNLAAEKYTGNVTLLR